MHHRYMEEMAHLPWLTCRCHTRGESQGTCNVACRPSLSSNKAEPTLALKPRGDITRSLKQGYQWLHEKDSCPPKTFLKKSLLIIKVPRCHHHPFSKSHGNLKSMNKLTLNEPATANRWSHLPETDDSAIT